jgi:uncharacterized DUF497 family protein
MAIVISQKILEKLKSKHSVCQADIQECFANRTGAYLLDIREKHDSDPPTQWFIAETNYGRSLKVVFVCRDTDIYIRTAYKPNEKELSIYEKYAC